MKDFVKWLGVDEKVAKVAVWLLIFMVSLIIINVFLESLGFPYYKITVENLSKIDLNNLGNTILDFVLSSLNFYATILLVVRVKDFKSTIKYLIVYLIFATLITQLLNYVALQVFIFLYIIAVCFIYGNKKPKYILYGIGSLLINTAIQAVCYLYKGRFIDFESLSSTNRIITSLDYFIVMMFIIIVKEIYLKKKSEVK